MSRINLQQALLCARNVFTTLSRSIVYILDTSRALNYLKHLCVDGEQV